MSLGVTCQLCCSWPAPFPPYMHKVKGSPQQLVRKRHVSISAWHGRNWHRVTIWLCTFFMSLQNILNIIPSTFSFNLQCVAGPHTWHCKAARHTRMAKKGALLLTVVFLISSSRVQCQSEESKFAESCINFAKAKVYSIALVLLE